MITVAICENNPAHAKRLTEALIPLLPLPYDIAVFSGPSDFLEHFEQQSHNWNLVFLDISQEDNATSGIRLAQTIQQRSPGTQIIFVSQTPDFSPSRSCDDYLSNPGNQPSIAGGLLHSTKEQPSPHLERAVNTALKTLALQKDHYLHFKWKHQDFQLPWHNILYMERILRTTQIHTQSEQYPTSEPLDSLIQRLPDSFVVCHRSFAVNLETVVSISRGGLILSSGQTLPVGRTSYDHVKKTYTRIVSGSEASPGL